MTEVKICGIRTADALEAAIAAGADYIGLVFFAKSPRNVSREDAADLAGRARANGSVRTVALLVDPTPDDVRQIASTVAPDIIQLHGHEDADAIARTRANAPRCGIWKAVPVATRSDVDDAAGLLRPGVLADMVLYDAKPPPGAALPGGTGLSFDWNILTTPPVARPFVLAGGLTPANVAEAVRRTGAPIVDVSSGVESAPGIKSAELVAAFVRAARSADPGGDEEGRRS